MTFTRTNGLMQRTHEVHCAGCEQAALGLANNRAKAEQELRQIGWAIRAFRWHCSDCKDNPTKVGRALPMN